MNLLAIRVDEELNKLIVEESDSRQKEEKMNSLSDGNQSDLQSQIDADGDIHGGGIGTISFVSCGNKEAKEAADATLADSAKEEGESKDSVWLFLYHISSSSHVWGDSFTPQIVTSSCYFCFTYFLLKLVLLFF